ncbi:MAG: hypothetical protein ACFFCH_02010 [Promethearchaeota archaeon]
MSLSDVSVELRRITILERNAEYYDAAEHCFILYQRTRSSDVAKRGFNNLWLSAWTANSKLEMEARLSDFLSRFQELKEKISLMPEQETHLTALSLAAQGWLAEPPNPSLFHQAVQKFLEINQLQQALELIMSLIAYVKPEDQIYWINHAQDIAKELHPANRDTYFLLLAEPLLHYAETDERQTVLNNILRATTALSEIKNRKPLGNIAVIHGVDLLEPYQIEPKTLRQIRQDNVHELVRSLATIPHNRLRGMMLNLLGNSYSKLAEFEQDPELRRDLYAKAKDYFLQSVSALERTPAYGELLRAYIFAGTGFLSIAELEQDFDRRNELYRLGKEHLRKAHELGEMTQFYDLRAQAAIHLGTALERLSWFELNPETRKERLSEIYEIQLEGQRLAQKTRGNRWAGYATIKASEICGFFSDLETRIDKKRQWATTQHELSQTGLKLLNQTQDVRGQIMALSNVAFACAKLAELTPNLQDKVLLLEKMRRHTQQAIPLIALVPDPIISASAYQQAGDVAKCLGILKGDSDLLQKAAFYFEKASVDWSKTGERHKEAQAITQHANALLFRSSFDFTPDEADRVALLDESQRLYTVAADLYSQIFFFHDVGESYWRIGQIHILRRDFTSAQESFDKVQKAFVKAAELIPNFADVYSVFSTFGITMVGLVDGLKIINQGNYPHAALLFNELVTELTSETERSLRDLRQLLAALGQICQYAATRESTQRKLAQTELNRLLKQLTPDAYEQQLPYSLHKTIHRLQILLVAPQLFFPPLLLDLPLKEKMLAMIQTRHMVGTALSMYQATKRQREIALDEPPENTIRRYVAQMSSVLSNR